MALITHHKDFRVSMIWQNAAKPSTDGTPITADWDVISSYSALTSQALPVEGLSFFSMNPTTRRVNRQTGSRHRTLKDTWNDLKGSIPGVTLSLPATQETIDLFLYLAMQRCTEGGTTPYVKAFELPVITGSTWPGGRFPEFNNNEGAFCGLVWSYAHTSGHFSSLEQVLLGAVCTELRLSCNAEEHDGQLWIEADFIGRYFDEGIAYTGTITAATEEDASSYHINDLAVSTILSVASTPLYGFGFTINTGAKFVPFAGVYDATSNAIACKDCILSHTVTGYVDYLVDDTSTTTYSNSLDYLKAQAAELTNVIAWGDGTTSSTGELDFTWQMQPTNLTPVGSDESRFRLEFDCLETSSNNLFKANVANALNRDW